MSADPAFINRRAVLLTGTAFAAFAVLGGGPLSRLAGAATTISVTPGEASIAIFSDTGARTGTKMLAKLIRSEAEWREILSPLAFNVTRQEGTERAFTGPFLDIKEPGIFRCVCCATALFDSAAKYDSRTGWPSFFEPIAKENVIEHEDRSYGMVRTAISCALCEAHLGHVFNDGPPPTGLRYCINGVALSFASRAAA